MAEEINSFKALSKVLSDRNLSPFDKNVFTALITFNGKNKIFPTRGQICERIGSRRAGSISKSLKKLSISGFIAVHHRKHSSNYYEINGVTRISDNDTPRKYVNISEVKMPVC